MKPAMPRYGYFSVLLIGILLLTAGVLRADSLRERRLNLVEQHLVKPVYGDPITDTRVLEAMRRVPRHRFVPDQYRSRAYENGPLPIGHGQTISQPYIVAYMTQLLELTPSETVLEIGTGSGYHAAVLAEVADSVDSIEIIPELADSARKRLKSLSYDTVTVRQGDGYYGWSEHAPFDAIVVTAAPSHIPPPLLEQLSPGGRMVIPVGSPFRVQQLMLVVKQSDGTFRKRGLMPVRFVPFTRSTSNE